MEHALRAALRTPVFSGLACALLALAPVQPTAGRGSQSADAGVRPWTGRAAEIEAYLRTAPIVRTVRTDRGVTEPVRAFFAPGGPIGSMTWKAIPPGMSRGFYESYKSEIAAYELDKLLALGMVPPKVERRIDGDLGVAVMWVDGVKSFAELGGAPKPPPARVARWNSEIARAKMFHNLIGDLDPNLGNWLIDSEWRVTLIDQSRALTTTSQLVHELTRVDAALWARMRALTLDELTRTLSPWLGKPEIEAILERRDLMQKKIDAARLLRNEALVSAFRHRGEEEKDLLHVLGAAADPELVVLPRELQVDVLRPRALKQRRRPA